MIVLLLRHGIARDWVGAFEMPADLALRLLERIRPADAAPEPRKDSVETMPDGSKKVSFASIQDLTAALAGAGWSGVKIGK